VPGDPAERGDDESSSIRDDMLRLFATRVQDKTAGFVTRFLDGIGKLAWQVQPPHPLAVC